MGRQATVVLYVVLLAAIVVAVDFLFFRNRVLGTADSEYRNCLGVRSFLLEISEASMKA